jgi:hypothetical protein
LSVGNLDGPVIIMAKLHPNNTKEGDFLWIMHLHIYMLSINLDSLAWKQLEPSNHMRECALTTECLFKTISLIAVLSKPTSLSNISMKRIIFWVFVVEMHIIKMELLKGLFRPSAIWQDL